MAKKYRRVKRRKNTNTSWKSLKRRFRVKKRLRRLGLAFIVFFGVLLTLGAIYIWHYFTRPFARASGTFETDISWNGATPLNLLWLEVGEIENETAPLINLSVVSLNPTLKRLTTFNLPLGYKVYLPSQGKHPLRTIYGVGNLLDPKQGIKLTAKNVSYLLGIPIDGYLLVGSEGLRELNQLFSAKGAAPAELSQSSAQLMSADASGQGSASGGGDVRGLKDYLSIKNITLLPRTITLGYKYLKTNLSLSELGRVVYFVWRVRADKITTIALDAENLSDRSTLDRHLISFLKDETLAGERLKIQILNGTLKPSLAAFAARLVRNMGGEVIRIGNYDRQDLTKGFLVLNESGSYTAKRLAHIFGVVDSRPPRSSIEKRADITVILGLENYKKIF